MSMVQFLHNRLNSGTTDILVLQIETFRKSCQTLVLQMQRTRIGSCKTGLITFRSQLDGFFYMLKSKVFIDKHD